MSKAERRLLQHGGLRQSTAEQSVDTSADTVAYVGSEDEIITPTELLPRFVRVENRHATNWLYVQTPGPGASLQTATTGSMGIPPSSVEIFGLAETLTLAQVKISVLGSANPTTYAVNWLP